MQVKLSPPHLTVATRTVKVIPVQVALLQYVRSSKSEVRWPNNMTRKASSLLLFGLAKGAIVMQRSKTHFEQIPVATVKKIATEIHDSFDGDDRAVTTTPASKLKPYLLPSLANNRKRM